MSTQEWAAYQRQVWRERQQKRRARLAGEEGEAAEDVGTEDDDPDVEEPSSPDAKQIRSIGADVKKNVSTWHNQFSQEDVPLLDCEHEGKFTEHGTELQSILSEMVSTILPGYAVSYIHAKLSSMNEPAYFGPRKPNRQSRNSQKLADTIDYNHWRLLLIPGMFSLFDRSFLH